PLFLTTRGVHAWADNQDYFQLFLAPLHAVKDSREALLLVHSLALFAPGFLVLLLLRKMPFQAIGASLFVWLSPFLINANLDLIHTESFATVFLIGVYTCAKRGHVLGFILCSLSALSCKEDVAFTYAMLMLLIYWKHNDFKISRSVALFGCITAICIFLTNFFWVLPNFKLATCQWLNPTFSIDRLDYAPTAPFFRTFFTDIQTAAFYQRMLGRPELGLYLLKLCWPLLLLGRAAWPFALAIIPGVALNTISNTGYYIEAYYHYDHSTFAAVIIALLWALPRAKLPRTRAILIGSTAVVLHLALPSWFRMHVTEMPQASWWVKATHPAVTTLELLREKLPSGLVISADYNSLNYLLNPAQTVFMYENPIRRHYFGIYFVCEDLAAPPPVDLVIIRQSYDVKPEMDLLLSR
ncbi:MAG: DUF2079 domain-containing protein, partial [Bdellovibrionales bacterium]|nr:DUF2079 domain-containing protein [Bdellovibrionales bacterium]